MDEGYKTRRLVATPQLLLTKYASLCGLSPSNAAVTRHSGLLWSFCVGKLHPSQVPGGAGALLSLFPFCIHGTHQPGRPPPPPPLAPSLLAFVSSGSTSLWVPSKRQVNSPRMRRGPGAAAGEANFGQFQIGPCIAAMATLVRKKNHAF